MEKVTIEGINSQQKTSKAGKPYTSVGIKTKEHGEQWLNGFGNKTTESWKKGDVVEIEIEKKEFGGKEYVNFKVPGQAGGGSLSSRIDALEARVNALENKGVPF